MTRNEALAARGSWRRQAARAGAALVFGAALSGCTLVPNSAPADMYVLEAAAPRVGFDCALSFSVREVRLAGHLDRPEIVIGKVGARIETSQRALWASTPARELPAAIARALARRLRGSQIVPHPWRFGETPALAIEVDVDRLEPEGGQLVAEIRWSAAEPRGQSPAVARGSYVARVPMAAGDAAATAAAVVTALGGFVDALATRMAEHPQVGTLCEAK
ncbi:MAG: membrane integrity-associated transporter subunit PqiC [Burkholderiales bacterium]|nr:MAG: membrane integrity-associated transporter subunit PqiC [Burkholderiales bacterium]